ncbi:MAG: DsbA family protein [Anaerolineales bacterium]
MPAKRKTKTVKRKKSEEVLNFRIKRSQFYAAAVPLAFLLGLAFGYVSWGLEDQRPVGEAAVPTGESSVVSDIASQIENLPRYEVTIEPDDPVLGPEGAPVTIVEFSDFECPFCERYAQQTHGQLLETYGGQIRFVYKDFPITSLHAHAFSAAVAAQCAREQDAFWPYHDLLFSGELPLGAESYVSYAERLNLNMTGFLQCLDEERNADIVQGDFDYGIELGVTSTPTFFINGIALVGAQPFELFAQIIDYELAVQ